MKKILSLFLSVLMLTGMVTIGFSASAATSGSCGNNVTYILDGNTLTITGTGNMKDYSYSSGTPWYSDRSSIENVVINSGVTRIGECAFGYCESLTSVTIPDSVKSIGSSAFEYCESLASITIPDSVTSINNYVFFECTSLTSVTIGNSVTSIGYYAFGKCSSLTSVTIPDSVKVISDSAFDGCTSLTSITLPVGITEIAIDTFRNCSSLTSVTIPTSVKSIGDSAFYDCDSLTSITIPDSVTSIGDFAFYDCESLTSVTIPDSVTSIGGYAFAKCTSLKSITVDSNNAYYSLYDGALFDKEKTELIVYPACKSGSSYTVPDTVITIDGYAFYNCENLTSVTIGNNVTSIGYYTFCNCTSLTSITIPDSVTSIGNSAFSDCTSLTSVTIGNSVTSISYSAFSGCTSLTSITIPDSVTSINAWAFLGCTSLTSITLPVGITEIAIDTFRNCSSLKSIKIPDSVTHIGEGAFQYCESLTSIAIPNRVTSIDRYAFYGCSNLSDVYYSGSEDEWNKIKKYESYTNYELFSATIHYNSYVITDSDYDEQSDVSFGFGGTLHTNPTRGLAGESVTLYGYFDTDDESFDASAALKGVSWSVSGVSATVTSASIGYSSAAPTTTGEEKTRYEWSVTVALGSELGDVKITGTTSEGNTASYKLEVYEPEMELKAPSSIYTLTSLNTPQQITCTVTIDNSNPQYLENFMTKLGDEGNIRFEYVGYEDTAPIELKLDSSSYEISSDGKKAVYTINVYADHESHVIQDDVITAKVTFTSPSGKETSVNTDLALYLPSIDAWSFRNSGQETSVDQFKLVFDYDGSNLAKILYKIKKGSSENGICYGMALSSVSTYCGNPSITEWISSNKAYSATQANQNSSSKNYGITLNDYIMGLYVYQYSYEAEKALDNNKNKMEDLITAVEKSQFGSGDPVLITIKQKNQAHALVGYEVVRDGNEIRVYVYDCNYPGYNYQYISFTCNNSGDVTGWSYDIEMGNTFSSANGGSISYDNYSVQNASSVVLSDSTVKFYSSTNMADINTTILSSSADPFTITTSAGETVTYDNGTVEGSASGIIPIQAACYSLDNPDAVEDTADFYLDDIGTFTVQNNGSADEKVSTLYADDHSDITIYSDGRSTVTLNETNDVFNASVVPTVTDTVTMVFSTDDEKTIFEVAGITGETTNMSAVCDENQVKFSGIDAGTVTVTSGETTTSVNFDSNGGDNEYYATLSDDGSVSVELAAEVDNANNGSASNTGNTVSTGSTSSSSAKSGDSTAETASTGSASGSADESSQGSNTVSSSSGKTSPATGASIGVVALVMVVSCGAAVLTFIRRRRRNTEN